MDQTKLTAHLPTVDVQITRRTHPEQGAETITIHITAAPSFDAAAQWLLHASLFPIAPPLSLWADVMRAWQPWLAVRAGSSPSLPEPD
ncbi:hypothetical protein LMG28614_03623 [Paraburkholderia ultramafica]|uniref:Uncharacterized protein n=1 Tax=Paraburkholderia ultramafica TaxID=1544867 RepID=A0A6S7B9U6_9BURK|nr:hypothetical protein [Paraburkholderia ultramafica]CAB3792994.1 hypothetical protein LMG28614_03623 [Paraburkholderia ultramafica]